MRGFLLVGLVMLVALPARAEETFPGAIKSAANIPCAPTCLLCHTSIPGNIGNLKQPFGLAVLGNGIVPGNPDSMKTVVANLRSKQVDSDKDGKLDVDELAASSDPNKSDPNADVCAPEYGCGAHLVQAPPPTQRGVLWLAIGIGLATVAGVRAQQAAHRRARGQEASRP